MSLLVKIPSGVESGMIIRVREKGHQEPVTGKFGDFLICVLVHQNSKNYKSKGNDLMSNYYITLTQAILGCKIDVHTIDGPTILTLTPGV